MSRTVHELPRAIADVQHIAAWIHDRSPQGSLSWLDAYDEMVEQLVSDAERFSAAPEQHPEFDVRQAFFKTLRGSTYRALFFIQDDRVYILRVRGPGQARVKSDDLNS